MRQSFNRPLLRTCCGRSLFARSSLGHSADGTVPVADRGSLRANFVPATISATTLPFDISPALRNDRYERILFLEFAACSGHAGNFGIVGTKVAPGECHFCRFHIYGDSTAPF